MVSVKKTDYLRTYRESVAHDDLVSYGIVIDETDLLISSSRQRARTAYESTARYRGAIQSYGADNPPFLTSFKPVPHDGAPPGIVSAMLRAADLAGVGPMASVAGAIAEHVGKDLLRSCTDVIIENGGDLFISTSTKRLIGTFAGTSSFSGKIFFEIPPNSTLGICTSSGTVGYSQSFGKADAVTVIAPSATLADAAATAICNRVSSPRDIEGALAFAQRIPGLLGVLVLIGDEMGMWGTVSLSKESTDERIVLAVATHQNDTYF